MNTHPTTMRAAIITEPGGPEVLQVRERPVPAAAAGELLVRVHATAVNRADLHQREGHYPAPSGAPVDIPGVEFAGEVAGVGSGAGDWREGDRVFGIVGGGGYAEYLTTDAQSVARVPESLSWTDAAAIPEVFITAYDALVTQAAVARNERVLIHAVGSGVGLAAVQIARAWHAVPFGTARTADKIERARTMGLEAGVTIANADHLADLLAPLAGARGFDVTLDLVGGPYLAASVRAAASRGRLMLIGTVAGRTAELPLGIVLGKRLTLRGTVLRARSLEEKRAVTAAFVRDLVPLLAFGTLRPVVDRVYPLRESAAAHAHVASNETFGKVVIEID